jgi:hypothetical protein
MRADALVMAAICLALSHGAVWLAGATHVRNEIAAEQAASTIGASEANTETSNAVGEATSTLALENNRLAKELADARAAIHRFRTRPAAPGTVGASARIDPDLARDRVCRVERLRDPTSPLSRNCPADPADRGAALESLPARPAA